MTPPTTPPTEDFTEGFAGDFIEGFDEDLAGDFDLADADLLSRLRRIADDQHDGSDEADPRSTSHVTRMVAEDAEAFARYAAAYAAVAPEAELPTLAELAQYLDSVDCPQEARNDAGSRLGLILSNGEGPEVPTRLIAVRGTDGNPVSICALVPGIPLRLAEALHFVDNMVARKKSLRHPLAPLVRAWHGRPYDVVPNQRTTGRIIPAKLAQAEPSGDSRAGRLFSLAAHSPDGQLILPGFATETIGPALPLVLYDLGNGPSSTSRAAPLALRVFIEGLLAVPQADRGTGRPVAYEVSLREFLDWFWPDRSPTPSEYWPALNAAREALFKCLIPLVDPDTGRGQMRQIVNIGAIPHGARAMDDAVRVVVDLPRDSQNGPQIPDSLRAWGNRSAPAYRALINLAFHWHNPGRNPYRGPRRRDGQGHIWLQAQAPDHYPMLSDQQIIELCYPTSANNTRRKLLQRARQTITRLEEAGELRIVDSKILPPPPSPRHAPQATDTSSS